MNAKALTILAVLAVAAVAVVGAGYAYYWGQTQINDNQVDVEYLAVSTEMTAINETVEFNTTYVSGTGYTISTTPALETIDESGKNLANCYTLVDGEEYTISAPTQLTDFDFQVTLEDVTLGTNAKLWFGYGASNGEAVLQNKLFELVPTSAYSVNTPLTYVAVVPYDSTNFALVEDETNGGYTVTLKAYVYLQEAVLTVDNVNVAKCNIGTSAANDGKLKIQAAVDKVTYEESETKGTWTLTGYDAFDSVTIFDKGVFEGATYSDGSIVLSYETDHDSHPLIIKLTDDDDIIYKVLSLKVSE